MRWFLSTFSFCFFLGLISIASGAMAQDDDDPILSLLKDPDREMRAVALEHIRSAAPGEEATRNFAKLLSGLSDDATSELLVALADRGDPAAAPSVRAAIKSTKSEDVRVAAIRALGKLGKPEDLPVLIEFLDSDSKDTREAAHRSLVVLPGEDVSAAMAEAMTAAPTEQRVTLIEILTTRRARNAIDAILQAAVADDAIVRGSAMASLGTFAEPEHIPGMVQGVLAAEKGRERDNAEKAIMLVCHRIEDKDEQAAPLLAAMDDLSPADRVTLLSTLGRIGGPQARDVIEDAIADEKLHDAGLTAICNWPFGSIAFRLLELARTEENAGHRRTALRAMIRVAPFPDERSDSLRLDLMRTAMAMSWEDADRLLILDRLKAVRTVETLRYVLPYTNDNRFSEQACLTVVELAHHSGLREAHREEFHAALDHVIETSKDATVIDRAQRYKKGQTWVRPK